MQGDSGRLYDGFIIVHAAGAECCAESEILWPVSLYNMRIPYLISECKM